jgi:hypothetical protein
LTFIVVSCRVATVVMKIHYILFLFLVGVLLSTSIKPTQAYADGGCLAINNGGVTTQQFCPTPTPAPAISQAPENNNQPQGNQGNTNQPSIYPSSSSQSTPDTGPSDWVLPSLFFLGALGILLRTKTKLSLRE